MFKIGDFVYMPSGMGGVFTVRILEEKDTDKGVYYSGVIDSRVPSTGRLSSDFHGMYWGAYSSECTPVPDAAAMKRLRPILETAIRWGGQ